MLEQVLHQKTPIDDFQVAFDAAGDRRRLLFNARFIDLEAGPSPSVLLAIEDITGASHRQIVETMNDALQLFQFSTDQAPDAVFWMDRGAGFYYVNDQACRSLGYSRQELLGLRLWDIDPVFTQERWEAEWAQYQTDGQVGMKHLETWHRRKDGSVFPIEVSAKHIAFGDNEFHVAFVRDISERKREEAEKEKLETQLFQAQKMESIGRLAGGVAHDFNNMLSVILGYAELIEDQLSPDDPLLESVLEIERAANRSRDTTRQLLAFSRKQAIALQLMDLNERIADTQKTLSRLIGEDIELRCIPQEGLWKIAFDAAQIDQILINLAVNARGRG